MAGTGTSSMDANYVRSKFVPKGNFSYENGNVVAPDFLDANYQNAMQSATPGSDVAKPGNLPLTTWVNGIRQYQTSSVYWLILASNGFVSWIGIKDGTPVTFVNVNPLQTNSQYADHSLSNPSATLTQMEI